MDGKKGSVPQFNKDQFKKSRAVVILLLLALPLVAALVVCGRKAEASDKNTAVQARKVLYYRHPMRPDVSSLVPAKDEMGMDYIPVYSDEVAATPSTVPGHGAVILSPERQQLIGVKTEAIEERDLTKTIRAAGKVAYDADLFNALMEFRQAHEFHEQEKRKSVAILRERADSLLQAAQSKLELLGYTEDQMKEFLKAGKRVHELTLKPGHVGVVADIYEYEISLVQPSQTVGITTPAYPGKIFKGEIQVLDPSLNSATRTLRARIDVEDLRGELKPEMFVNADIEVPLGTKPALPESALFNAGEKQLVFVATGEGHFEPREVKLGTKTEDYYEVLSGLVKGEVVVTSANFLIDSESRFQSALQGFSSGGRQETAQEK